MKTIEELKEYLEELGITDSVCILTEPSYVTAIVGVDLQDLRVIYDYDLMVEFLVETEGFTEEDAIEWIEYNTIRALPYMEKPGEGIHKPIILQKIHG